MFLREMCFKLFSLDTAKNGEKQTGKVLGKVDANVTVKRKLTAFNQIPSNVLTTSKTLNYKEEINVQTPCFSDAHDVTPSIWG